MKETSNSTSITGKDLLSILRNEGLTQYGAVFTGEQVRRWLGIEMPEVARKSAFDSIALRELSAIDYCRDQLLGEGKYLKGEGAGYRILLPSENMGQVEAYEKSAKNKTNRALKLVRSMPPSDTDPVSPDTVRARLLFRQDQAKRSKLGSV